MVGDLRQGHEGEAHAKAQQASRAGDVRDAAHLLGLPEALRVRLLNEDVNDGQVLAGVVVHLVLQLARESAVVQTLTSPPV